MTNNSPIKITVQPQAHPNLRKLARALIAIARQQTGDQPQPTKRPKSATVKTTGGRA